MSYTIQRNPSDPFVVGLRSNTESLKRWIEQVKAAPDPHNPLMVMLRDMIARACCIEDARVNELPLETLLEYAEVERELDRALMSLGREHLELGA